MIDKLTLSPTSINDFYNCQRRWYYIRYLKIPVTLSGRSVLGRCYHGALSYSYRQKINGNTLDIDDVINVFSNEWNIIVNGNVDWHGENPKELFDVGIEFIKIYLNDILPNYTPIKTEEMMSVFITDGIELVGYPDVVCTDGSNIIIIDHKIRKRRITADDAKKDVQITSYGRILNRPIIGEIHCALQQNKPKIDIVTTTRDEKDYEWFNNWVVSTWRTIKLAKEFLPNPNWWGCREPSEKGGCEVWELCHLA